MQGRSDSAQSLGHRSFPPTLVPGRLFQLSEIRFDRSTTVVLALEASQQVTYLNTGE
jgi:hypothetical protein